MKEIKIKPCGSALVDDDDYERLNQYKWYLSQHRYSCHVARSEWDDERKRNVTVYMHQDVIGKKEGFEIDHVNGNGLDNRRSNLRHCSRSQNQMNCSSRDRKSKYKGVYATRHGRWIAQLCFNRNHFYVGTYETEEAAAIAYNKIATEKYGEFAKLNSISRVMELKEG